MGKYKTILEFDLTEKDPTDSEDTALPVSKILVNYSQNREIMLSLIKWMGFSIVLWYFL